MQRTFSGARDRKIVSRRRFVATAIGVPFALAWGWINRERAEAADAPTRVGTERVEPAEQARSNRPEAEAAVAQAGAPAMVTVVVFNDGGIKQGPA